VRARERWSSGLVATAAEDRLNISPTNPMPSRKFVVDPGHWRFRAEEARTVADQMTHEEARTISGCDSPWSALDQTPGALCCRSGSPPIHC